MTATQPALEQLHERLKANGVDADPRAVASALLAIARINEWPEHPERATAWLLQLALDVARPPEAAPRGQAARGAS
jgi:hypothetical protein